MLTSYKNNIGKAKISILNASVVGVIAAATINMTTKAYLYLLLSNFALIIPILVKIKLNTGIWNTRPLPMRRLTTKEIYLLAEINGSSSSFEKLKQNLKAGGINIKNAKSPPAIKVKKQAAIKRLQRLFILSSMAGEQNAHN